MSLTEEELWLQAEQEFEAQTGGDPLVEELLANLGMTAEDDYDPNPMDFFEQKGRQPREVYMVLAKGRDRWPTHTAIAMHGWARLAAGAPKVKNPPKPRLRTACQVFLTRANALGAYERAKDWADKAHGPGDVSPDEVHLFTAELDWKEVECP